MSSVNVVQGGFWSMAHTELKSHTRWCTLVRKLLYDINGKYPVTFFPDCDKFQTLDDLFDYIC